MRGEIERLIEQFGVRDHIRLTGYLDDQGIFDEILAARAMVLPSFAEGLAQRTPGSTGAWSPGHHHRNRSSFRASRAEC